MKTIGIKLADGSFYPVLEDNTPSEKKLELTTAHNNQTKVMVDLYRSATCSMDDAEYVDSLQIENLVARPNGEADIKFTISLDEDNQLSAKIVDSETGNESNTTITLVSRTLEERLVTDEYGINDSNSNKAGAVAAGAVAAGGLLAAAAAMREKVKDETEVEEEPVVENVDDGVPFGDETLVEEAAVEESVSNEEISADEPIIDETFADEALADDTITEDNSGLPDMDFDIPDDTTETETPEMPDDFFNTDDLDNTEERQETMKDPTFDSVSPAAGGLNFDGLYDEETERGTPAENGADEIILMNGRDEHNANKMLNRDILRDALLDKFNCILLKYAVEKVNSKFKKRNKKIKISYVSGVKKVFNISKEVNGKKTFYDITPFLQL